jgi:hypothetical protein
LILPWQHSAKLKGEGRRGEEGREGRRRGMGEEGRDGRRGKERGKRGEERGRRGEERGGEERRGEERRGKESGEERRRGMESGGDGRERKCMFVRKRRCKQTFRMPEANTKMLVEKRLPAALKVS